MHLKTLMSQYFSKIGITLILFSVDIVDETFVKEAKPINYENII